MKLATFLSAILFVLPLFVSAQPATYKSRGVTSYIVNYSAINGDRYLAEFAARRFALVDEGSKTDIKLIHAIEPSLPILHYKDIVALYPSFQEYAFVNRDEEAFIHSAEPSCVTIIPGVSKARICWLYDRRPLSIQGYTLQWMTDSLSAPQLLADTVLATPLFECLLPTQAKFLQVATRLQDGSSVFYGYPVRIPLQMDTVPWVVPDSINETRSLDSVKVALQFSAPGSSIPDSIFIIADWDRNNTLSRSVERTLLQKQGSVWRYSRSVGISGLRTNSGYEFRIEAWRQGKAATFPAQGSWHTNINNRLKNDYYGFFVMDVRSSTWRSAYISEIKKSFANSGYTGLFEDDCWYRIASYGGDAYPPFPYDEISWRTGLYEMLDSIRLSIHPKPAYFNGLYTDISDSLLLYTTGGMTEGFACTHWSGLVGGTSWQTQCERGLSASHRYRKEWMALGGLYNNTIQERLYALGSYLLVADSLSMFGNAVNYQEFAHYPEFDIPLGAPLESADVRISDLRIEDAGGVYYKREYTGGTVVVNPGDQPVNYSGRNNRPMIGIDGGNTIDGGRVLTVAGADTIAPRSCHIYLSGLVGQLLESPVIDSVTVIPAAIPADGVTLCTVSVLAHDGSSSHFRSDTTLPLYIVLDAGVAGGPRNLVLNPALPGPPVTPVWYTGSFSIPPGAQPDTVLLPFTVYSTTGLLACGKAPLIVQNGDPGNLALNFSFEIDNNDDGIPDFWRGYVKGFDYDTSSVNAKTGTRSVHLVNDSATDSRGVYLSITLNQTVPEKLHLSGWSKCNNVSGAQGNDYSLYVDAYYVSGKPLYGQTARFNTGTHDWQYASYIIDPQEPVKSLNLYALFRNRTGEVWFDQLSLSTHIPTDIESESLPDEYSIEVFPNPATTELQVEYRVAKRGHIKVSLIDCLGSEVARLREGEVEEGRYMFREPVSRLSPGMYYIVLRTAASYRVAPVIIQ